MSARDQGLAIEIAGGRLVVSIGIDALMIAVRGGDYWDDEAFVITDADALAASIVRGLEDEEDDGTTGIYLAIDRAVQWAVEYAEPGVEMRADESRGNDDDA